MNRNELIQVIYNDTSSATCPGCNCDKPEQEGNTGECCMKCAEEQLAEYEQKIYDQAIYDVKTKLLNDGRKDYYKRAVYWESIVECLEQLKKGEKKMIVTIYDYNGKARKVELKKEVETMAILVLSGDEVLEVKYKDGTHEKHESNWGRFTDFYDGCYFINEEILKDEKWLNSNDSYYRLSRALGEEK